MNLQGRRFTTALLVAAGALRGVSGDSTAGGIYSGTACSNLVLMEGQEISRTTLSVTAGSCAAVTDCENQPSDLVTCDTSAGPVQGQCCLTYTLTADGPDAATRCRAICHTTGSAASDAALEDLTALDGEPGFEYEENFVGGQCVDANDEGCLQDLFSGVGSGAQSGWCYGYSDCSGVNATVVDDESCTGNSTTMSPIVGVCCMYKEADDGTTNCLNLCARCA